MKGKRKIAEKENEVEAEKFHRISSVDEDCSIGMKKDRPSKKVDRLIMKGKRKIVEKENEVEAEKVDRISSVDEDCSIGMKKDRPSKKVDRLIMKGKRKIAEKENEVEAEKVDRISSVDEDCSIGMKNDRPSKSERKKEKNKLILKKKRRLMETQIEAEIGEVDQIGYKDRETLNKKSKEVRKSKKEDRLMMKKKKVLEKESDVEEDNVDQSEVEEDNADQVSSVNEDFSRGMKKVKLSTLERKKKKEKLMLKKKSKLIEAQSEAEAGKVNQICYEDGETQSMGKVGSGYAQDSIQSDEIQIKENNLLQSVGANSGIDIRKNTAMEAAKSKRKGATNEKRKLMEKESEVVEKVDHISLIDEDCSKGMKKWLTEYHHRRPGLEILQQRIDAFIIAHEAKEEQARKDREAQSAEGGWTVVVHHKGRKKTTDSETGIVVGSVAQAAVEDKLAKKKSKEVALDFYKFQRREARRTELMLLQSKFEQDKKRIQQMRAARKFRPY